MPLPVPIPQLVQNDGSKLTVGWVPLAGLSGLVTLSDGSGSPVGTQTGQSVASLPAPSGGNPPYTVTIAATDGTTTGPPSPGIPVLTIGSSLSEVSYDGLAVGLTVVPPPGGTDRQHQPTLIVDGKMRNPSPFAGLSGSVPLAQPPPASSCEVQLTDFLEVPVQPGYRCQTSAPPGGRSQLITQPAAVAGASWVGPDSYDVDAQGPSGEGPTVSSHRLRFGDSSGRYAEVDGPFESGRVPALASGEAPTWVMAAGLATSGGALVRGPFSARFHLIGEAPGGVRLALTAQGPLRASWTAIAPLPDSLAVSYRATLSLDGTAMETVAASALEVPFSTPLAAGAVPTVTVVALSSANSQGPPSQPVRGPLRAEGAVVAYDSLGRLGSVGIPAWGAWTYAYDDLGNLLAVKGSPASPR